MLPALLTSIPGPRSRACAEKLRRFEAREVTWLTDDFPVFWQRSEGVNVWDVDGNRFLDFTSAFGVCSLGHGAAPLREALVAQAGRLVHAMGDVHPAGAKADLCEALSRVTFERWKAGAGRAILCNSGSEAVEAALKTAFLHGGKAGVIAFSGGFHGMGYGSLEAGGIAMFRDPFQAQLGRFSVKVPYPSCYRCPFGRREAFRLEGACFPNCATTCLERIRTQIEGELARREIGCLLVEPVQARGGDIVPPRDFLTLLRQICDEHKILLILDEIYTGFNRTGRLFACEHVGVLPDIICLGKALTGGFPLTACVGRADIMDAWPPTTGEALHTSTTLGSPPGCAMALASIQEHEKIETRQQAQAAGRMLWEALRGINSPQIGHLRGLGAMIGVELIQSNGDPDAQLAGKIMRRGLQDGLILLSGGPAGNVLSFSPPFAISGDEIAWLVERLRSYLG